MLQLELRRLRLHVLAGAFFVLRRNMAFVTLGRLCEPRQAGIIDFNSPFPIPSRNRSHLSRGLFSFYSDCRYSMISSLSAESDVVTSLKVPPTPALGTMSLKLSAKRISTPPGTP